MNGPSLPDALEGYQVKAIERNIALIVNEANRIGARQFLDKSAQTCRIGSLANYSYALRHLDNDSLGKPFREHERHSISSFLAGLRHRMGPNSVKSVARNLVTFYNWLHEDVAMPRSFLKAFAVKGREPERSLIDDQDFDALLAAADGGPAYAIRTLRDQAILHLLRESGMRRSEIVSLNHGSVSLDPKGGTWLKMPTMAKRLKTGPRDILITKAAGALKALMMAVPGAEDDPIFRSLSDRTLGRRLWPNEVGRIVTRLRRQAGLQKRITPHLFRHTEATNLVKKGWNDEMINKKLWTPGSRMGRIYVHLDRSDLADQTRRDAGITDTGHDAASLSKQCPACAESIRAAALKCKHCGEWLTARPVAQAAPDRHPSLP